MKKYYLWILVILWLVGCGVAEAPVTDDIPNLVEPPTIEVTTLTEAVTPTPEPQITTTPFRLHWDMPEWTVVRRVDKVHLPQPWHDIPQPYQVTLTIYDDQGQLVQSITDLNQHQDYIHHEVEFRVFQHSHNSVVTRADIMHLHRWQGTGDGALAYNYFWRWDWQTEQFFLDQDLMAIEAMDISVRSGRIQATQYDRTGYIYHFESLEFRPYASFVESNHHWLPDTQETHWVEQQTHLATGTITMRTQPRWHSAVSIDWDVAVLGAEFTQSLVDVNRLQEYERVYRDNRVYELFWTALIDDPWDEDGLVLISEEVDGEWVYLQHFHLGNAVLAGAHTRYRISLPDLNFDGVPDLLVLMGHTGVQGLAYYRGFFHHTDGYIELVGLGGVSNLHIDYENQRFLGNNRSNAATRFFYIYHLIDGAVVMTDRIERTFLPENQGVAFITSLRDGQVVDETVVIADTPEGEPWDLSLLDERWRNVVW